MQDVIEKMGDAFIIQVHGEAEAKRFTANSRATVQKAMRAALSAASEAGYVMVPKEPTFTMINAGHLFCRREPTVSMDSADKAYRAMLGKAPKP